MHTRFPEATYRRVVEAAPTAFVLVDAGGRIVFVNAHTARLFGYAPEELIGQPVEVLVPARIRGAHDDYRSAYQREPAARAMGAGRDLQGVRKDGTEFPVEIGLSPIATDKGVFVLSTVVDITERKRIEARLTETAADLARSNTDLEQFAYVASHDLQEPLRMVSSFLSLLEEKYRGRLDADADRYIHYAVDGATRMHAMIGDLLAFSRAGRAGTTFADVPLAQPLEVALANLRHALEEAGGSVSYGPLPVVHANGTQIAHLFQNLIENAIKYRRDEPPRIQVSAVPDPTPAPGSGDAPARWRISVADNGLGIEPRFFDRIFRVFQRLHERAAYAGTGIGLAVVKRIVERHGGEVWLDSEPGQGSTFHFTLPAARSGKPEDEP